MKGRTRNQLCQCGSGLKAKKCSCSKQSEVRRASAFRIGGRVRKLHATGGCLYPNADKSTCGSRAIQSHTVRKSADLSAIARDGHVYQGKADLEALFENDGRIAPALIGVNRASTFLGFCAKHDTEIFSPLENRELGPTDEQAFLLAYRVISKELYLKTRQVETLDIVLNAAKGAEIAIGNFNREMMEYAKIGAKAAVSELSREKARFDDELLKRDFSNIHHLTFHLAQVPDIVCSGIVQPRCTFDDKPLQDLADLSIEPAYTTSSLLTLGSGQRGAAVFAWRSSNDAVVKSLLASLLKLPMAEIPSALVRFALSEFENCFLRPSWWESLPAQQRTALTERLMHNVGWSNQVECGYLNDDGIRPVSWTIERVSGNADIG